MPALRLGLEWIKFLYASSVYAEWIDKLAYIHTTFHKVLRVIIVCQGG